MALDGAHGRLGTLRTVYETGMEELGGREGRRERGREGEREGMEEWSAGRLLGLSHVVKNFENQVTKKFVKEKKFSHSPPGCSPPDPPTGHFRSGKEADGTDFFRLIPLSKPSVLGSCLGIEPRTVRVFVNLLTTTPERTPLLRHFFST